MSTLTTMNQTMSSGEIAKLTGKEHKNVLADIRKLLIELGIDSAEFSAQYKDSSGKENLLFNLPKRECLILVSGYSIKMRAAIIDRWQELENATQVIANTLQIDKEAMIKELKQDDTINMLKSRIEARNLKLQALKDKLAKQKQVLDARTTKLLAQGAKVKGDMIASKLDLPVDTITNLLKAHGSKLKPSEANNALVNLGYLEPTKDKVTSEGNYYGRTLVSSKSTHTTLARWFPAEFENLLEQINQYYLDKEQGLD